MINAYEEEQYMWILGHVARNTDLLIFADFSNEMHNRESLKKGVANKIAYHTNKFKIWIVFLD